MISVEFNEKDFQHIMSVLDRLERRIKLIKTENPKQNAKMFSNRLKIAFLSQKYANKVPRLNAKYQEWKKKKFPGTENKKGLMTYTLANSITHYPVRGGHYGGVNPKTTSDYRNSIVGKYGAAFEGIRPRTHQPKRPFIAMTRNDEGQNILKTTGHKDMLIIRRIWR